MTKSIPHPVSISLMLHKRQADGVPKDGTTSPHKDKHVHHRRDLEGTGKCRNNFDNHTQTSLHTKNTTKKIMGHG